MDVLSSIFEAIHPAWIVVALVGAVWAGIVCVAVPPRADQFPKNLGAALLGAVAGQAASGVLLHSTPTLGDVQIVGVSIGSVVALGIVRLLGA